MHRLHLCAIAGARGRGVCRSAASADTSEVTWQNRVVVAKSGAHCADDPQLLQPLSSRDPARGARQSRRSHRVRDPRRARQRPDPRFDRGRRHRARSQPGAPDDRAGAHRRRRAGRRARDHAGRHRARPVRLHGDRAGLRLPARSVHRAVRGQLEARPRGGDLGPDAGRARADGGVHGLGRRAARRHRGQDLARPRAALAEAGGVVLPPQPIGALPPPCAGRTAATRTSACAPSRRARTAATWTCSRCRSAPRCCCPASSTAAACSSATSTTPRATARSRAPRSRWAPRSRSRPRC